MKELNIEELSMISGGDAGDLVDGICAAIGVYGVYAMIVSATIPVIGQAAIAGCAVWAVGSGFDWW